MDLNARLFILRNSNPKSIVHSSEFLVLLFHFFSSLCVLVVICKSPGDELFNTAEQHLDGHSCENHSHEPFQSGQTSSSEDLPE